MKKEPIKIKPTYCLVECPECSGIIELSPDNVMEHIRDERLFLIHCTKCQTDYQLIMTKLKNRAKI